MASISLQDSGSFNDDDSTLRQAFLLGAALLLSIMLHAGLVLLVPDRIDEGAADFGSGGVVVSLGAAGREAGGEVSQSAGEAAAVVEAPATEARQVESLETLQEAVIEHTADAQVSEIAPVVEAHEAFDVESLEETAEPISESVTASEVVAAVLPEETLEIASDPTSAVELLTAPIQESEPVEAVETQEVVETVTALRTAPPVPKRRPRQPIVRQSVQPKAPPAHREEPKAPVEQESVTSARPQEAGPEKQTNAGQKGDSESQSEEEVAGEGGKSGRSGLSAVGDGDNTPGGGAPGAQSDYYRQILAWLEKHKRYPRRSKLRNETGVVMLRFVVSRNGFVSTSGITQSSGHKRLDKEALGMIERAQPLPAIPDDMGEAELNLVIPVKFELR